MGAWELLSETNITSSTSGVVITGLNITKDDFVKISVTRVSSSGSRFKIFPNNLTSESGYFTKFLVFDGTNISTQLFSNDQIPFFTEGGDPTYADVYCKLTENGNFNTMTNTIRRSQGDPFINVWHTTRTTTFSGPITQFNLGFSGTGLQPGTRIQIYRLAAEKVADITVGSNTTRVDITGLNINKENEYLLLSDFNAVTSNCFVSLFANNNTNTFNYRENYLFTSGSTVSTSASNKPALSFLSSGNRGFVKTYIKLSNFNTYTAQNFIVRNSGSSDIEVNHNMVSSTTSNISNINQLNIISSVSNEIKQGTRFMLYKLY